MITSRFGRELNVRESSPLCRISQLLRVERFSSSFVMFPERFFGELRQWVSRLLKNFVPLALGFQF